MHSECSAAGRQGRGRSGQDGPAGACGVDVDTGPVVVYVEANYGWRIQVKDGLLSSDAAVATENCSRVKSPLPLCTSTGSIYLCYLKQKQNKNQLCVVERVLARHLDVAGFGGGPTGRGPALPGWDGDRPAASRPTGEALRRSRRRGVSCPSPPFPLLKLAKYSLHFKL